MRPAEGEADRALLGQSAVAAIAVHLQHAREAREMRDGPLGRTVGGVDVDGAGRIASAPGPVVTGVGPELAGLGPPAAWIEHRRRGLIGEQLVRGLQRLQQARVQRPQQEGGPAGPVRQRRAVEIDPLAGIDLSLPVEWQMVGVLADDNVGDQGLGGQAALDQPRGRWRLHDHLLAGAAGVLRPAHHQHPEPGGDHIQPLGDVFADPVQGARAARAGPVLDVDDLLDPGQVRRQRSAVATPPGGALLAALGISGFGGGHVLGLALLHVLQRQLELIDRQALGSAAEAVALQLLDDLPQPLGLGRVRRALGDEQRLQRRGIVRQGLGQHRHRPGVDQKA